MQSDKVSDDVEPLALTIAKTAQVTSESRSKVYEHIAAGTYQAVKSGRRTLIVYASVKAHIAGLPPARIKAPKPRPPRAVPEARRGRKPKPAAPASPPES
jgi:excisionase family DNA binding protein